MVESPDFISGPTPMMNRVSSNPASVLKAYPASIRLSTPPDQSVIPEGFSLKTKVDVMIVEDNHRARRALSYFIRLQAGLQVASEASNGADAIDLIKQRVPDVILMDARMPVMDGIEAIRIIKKHWPQVKIIVLSMYSQYELEASEAGADAFLRKCCDTGQIVSTLQSFFNSDKTGIVHLRPESIFPPKMDRLHNLRRSPPK